MRQTINYLSILLLLMAVNNNCFSQENELTSKWQVSISSGRSFIDYFEEFETGYSTGLTIAPEVNYRFSRFFSASFSLLFTTAHSGDKNVSFDRVLSAEAMEGAKVFNHYQTTLAPLIQFAPINSNKHNLYIEIGPSYTFGNSLFSETVSEASSTIAKSINDIGYIGTFGYKYNVAQNWTIGGKYIYNKNEKKTDHILFSIGYKL